LNFKVFPDVLCLLALIGIGVEGYPEFLFKHCLIP